MGALVAAVEPKGLRPRPHGSSWARAELRPGRRRPPKISRALFTLNQSGRLTSHTR